MSASTEVNEESGKPVVKGSFKHIKIYFFNKFKLAPCDLYVKLSDTNFVKVLKQLDEIGEEFLRKYQDRKVKHFYLTKEDCFEYKDLIYSFTPVTSDIVIGAEEGAVPTNESMNAVLKEIGVPGAVSSSVNKMSSRILGDLDSKRSFTDIIKSGFQGEERFNYDHSYMTGVVSCLIAGASDWRSPQVNEKLVTASIFHDLSLEGTNSMARDGVGRPKVGSNEDSELDLDHAKKMAIQLKSSDDIPSDVIKIIEFHHQENNPSLSPIVCAFIVAHSFVLELYESQFDPEEIPGVLEKLENHFKEENYLKQVEVLKEQILKNL
jgi:hypothetical protein